MKFGDTNTLIIGYGNTLRNDDGVGYRLAERIATLSLLGLEVLASHQLTPDLAEAIAKVNLVIFADASADTSLKQVTVKNLGVEMVEFSSSHSCHPSYLLQLAKTLYGYSPKAYWLMLPCADFGLGETLSAKARQSQRDAFTIIQYLLLEHNFKVSKRLNN